MKAKNLFIYSLFILSVFLWNGCSEDRDLNYLDSVAVPSNLDLLVQVSQDNTGTVTFTPGGTSASLFFLDFGDGTEVAEVSPGNSIDHSYPEGSYTAILRAQNINGEVSEPFEQLVVVSFVAPQNLTITITPVAGDNFSIQVSAEADYAVGFEVYFGDVLDEVPTPLMLGENVTHTYATTGAYEVTVVALSGGTETTQITETVVIDNPINLPINFEDETLEFNFINFAGGFSTIIDNPDPSGINSSSKVGEFFKEDGALVYAGSVIELGEPMDFSEFQSFKMDVWSPIAGSLVKLKIENADDPNISAEIDAFTTTTNTWETLYFNFVGTDFSQQYSKIVVFFDFGNIGAGDTFYYDNIDLALAPGLEIGLPLDFENATLNYQIIGFEGAESNLDDNPDASGINASAKVIKTTKTVGAQFYAGTAIPIDTPIVFDTTERIKLKTWSPKANIPVRLKLENGSGDFIELDVNTTVANQWEELVWDFSGMNTSPEFTTVVVFFEFVVDLPGDGTTYYFDDIDYAN